ncbi:MAG: leucine-rich repeat domain-containing protein, partial [Bacteroidaceae bacterium]|nr:leucine-rich repeat domain-containing protein [Bacteroidaceae bacterium]
TRVVSIDLENCGLTGELVDESWNPVLSELTYLNISRNSLTGDLTPFVADMPKLKTLYAHHNRLTEISGPLPSDIASLNTRSQNRVYTGDGTGWESVRPDVAGAPLLVWLSSAQDLTLPSLFTYYAGGNDNSLVPQVFVEYTHSPGNFYGSLNRDEATGWWTFGAFNNLVYDLPQNADVWLTPETEAGLLSAYPAHLRYVPGDANFSGFTDVLDVQWTLNYILSPTNALPFNRSAANTYEDATVNVQDIVCTVNIVLENDEDGADPAGVRRRMRRQMLAEDTPAQCWFYAEDGRVKVETEVPVAALDIELEGVSTDEVSLLLNHSHYQMRGRNTARGSRYVIFSPDGSVIPADSPTALLALSRSGRPTAVQCADKDAREVASTIGLPTGVASVGVGGRSGAIYDISGRRVEQPRRGLYIQNGQKLLKK